MIKSQYENPKHCIFPLNPPVPQTCSPIKNVLYKPEDTEPKFHQEILKERTQLKYNENS